MRSTLTGAAVLVISGLSLLAQSRPQQGAQRTAPRESDARPIRVLFLGHDQQRPHPLSHDVPAPCGDPRAAQHSGDPCAHARTLANHEWPPPRTRQQALARRYADAFRVGKHRDDITRVTLSDADTWLNRA